MEALLRRAALGYQEVWGAEHPEAQRLQRNLANFLTWRRRARLLEAFFCLAASGSGPEKDGTGLQKQATRMRSYAAEAGALL